MPRQQILPVIRRLPKGFSLVDAFLKLSMRPGCLWLDSSARGPEDASALGEIGRYSFLMADPIKSVTAVLGQPEDPWKQFEELCRSIPQNRDSDLPPFQGGVAGLIGYESASWLEATGVARENDLPTPAMSLGLYDWTVAYDHQNDSAWLICQGLTATQDADRVDAANARADEIESLLLYPLPRRGGFYAHVGLYQSDLPAPRQVVQQWSNPLSHRKVTSNFTSGQYQETVAEVVRRIRSGDSFQVNLAQRLLRKSDLTAPELYLRLRKSNPAPFSAYYGGDQFAVLSSSPEGFLRVRDGEVETRPIKGTVPRTGDPHQDDRLAHELITSDKDRAENIMIVDLMRNDLARVCADESVAVTQLCKVERYEFVQDLVSAVRGRLRKEVNIVDLLKACFPGGSITGAPKIEAMRTIAALEPHHRGPYCGSIGYIGCGGYADFNILIRTITAAHGYWQIPVGGGITARSHPESEEAETWTKAEGMLRAIPEES